LLCLTERIPYVTPYYYKKHNGDDAHQKNVIHVKYVHQTHSADSLPFQTPSWSTKLIAYKSLC